MNEIIDLLQMHFDEIYPDLKLIVSCDRSKKDKCVVIRHDLSSSFQLTKMQAETMTMDINSMREHIIKMLADEIRFISTIIEGLWER